MKLFKSILLASVAFISNAFAAININTATIDELQTLKGIGDVKAKAIVDYRTENGNFNSVDELMKVSGIGEKILESIRAEISVGEEAAIQPEVVVSPEPKAAESTDSQTEEAQKN